MNPSNSFNIRVKYDHNALDRQLPSIIVNNHVYHMEKDDTGELDYRYTLTLDYDGIIKQFSVFVGFEKDGDIYEINNLYTDLWNVEEETNEYHMVFWWIRKSVSTPPNYITTKDEDGNRTCSIVKKGKGVF
jgi:hypothetical protein